ncbi:MAG: hypothetical protein IJY44_00030 [Bacteroidaceae bacterium]|nr:hypothetical protein [Bacteroidaceae bacterium]
MKRFLLSFACFIVVLFAADARVYTYNFENGDINANGGTVSLGSFEWTAPKVDKKVQYSTSQNALQIGSKTEVCPNYSLKTTAFKDFTIRSITVYSHAAGTATMTIKAGDKTSPVYTLGTTDGTSYTLEDINIKGEIEISWEATDKAYYFKGIEIDYILPASMVEVEKAVFKTPLNIYADSIYRVSVEIGTEDKDLRECHKLYFTTDGTDPSYEDFIAEKEGCTTETSKTWAMYFDGKRALKETTTIKVLSMMFDGDVAYTGEITEATYIVSPTKPFTAAAEIKEGSRYAFFANDSVADALHTTIDNGYLQGRKVAKKERYIETVAYDAFIFTAVEGGYTIQDGGERYMYVKDNETTFSFATEKPEEGAVWTVSFDDGKAVIKNGESTVYYVKESIKNDVKEGDHFGCYKASEVTSDMELPSLYMLYEYPKATISPSSNSDVEDFKEITITCDKGIAFKEGTVIETYVELSGSDVDATGYKTTKFTGEQVDANTLRFTSSEPVTTFDNLQLYINLKGTIYLEPDGINMSMPMGIGFYKEAIAQYRLVGNAPAAKIEKVEPANNAEVESLNNIIFTFNKIVNGNDSTRAAKLYLEGSEELIPLTFASSVEGLEVGHKQAVLMTEAPVTANGTYILAIEDGYFLDRNGRAIAGTTLKYIVKNETSIEDIVAEDEKRWTVYDITGVKVLDTEDAEQLNTLQHGIYIINGKKWIVE